MRFFTLMCFVTSIIPIQKAFGANDQAHARALEAECIAIHAESDALGDQLRYRKASEKIAIAEFKSYSDELDQHEANFHDKLREKFLKHIDTMWEYDFSKETLMISFYGLHSGVYLGQRSRILDKYEKVIETKVKSGNQ